jgi:hypothetical protein
MGGQSFRRGTMKLTKPACLEGGKAKIVAVSTIVRGLFLVAFALVIMSYIPRLLGDAVVRAYGMCATK